MARTREVTLYRLVDLRPTYVGMREAIDWEQVDPDDVHDVDVAGSPGVWVERTVSRDEASWCVDATRTTGREVSLEENKPSGLLVVAVDDDVYGVGYAYGHRLLVDDVRDTRFGISVAIRALDEQVIQDLSRRRLGARGRTDMTFVPDGLPIWGFGIERQIDIVREAGGKAAALRLTFNGDEDRPVRLKGSAGLRLPLGIDPVDFVADIMEIARVRRCAPRSGLEFVEWITPVSERRRVVELDDRLDEILGRPEGETTGYVMGVVPVSQVSNTTGAGCFDIKVGTKAINDIKPTELWLRMLHRARVQLPGERVTALREGAVTVHRRDGTSPSSKAIKWLEVDLPVGVKRFTLVEGEWYEIGEKYTQSVHDEVLDILTCPGTIGELPRWDQDESEEDYNKHVAAVDRRYVCLDRKYARTALHDRGRGFEMCDLLGPDNELIHVKKAEDAQSLSHLFGQALVSTQNLWFHDEARNELNNRLRDVGSERQLQQGWVPKRVVFAILLKGGKQLDVDTLFPFSQVMLANTAEMLHSRYSVDVEVVGIAAVERV